MTSLILTDSDGCQVVEQIQIESQEIDVWFTAAECLHPPSRAFVRFNFFRSLRFLPI